jgi:hypothetical protein
MDDSRLSSGAKSRELKGRDNHETIPINGLLSVDQTRHGRPCQRVVGEPKVDKATQKPVYKMSC